MAFSLPASNEAHEPPEARGLARDAVRMLVARRGGEELTHSTFNLLPTFLDEGDVVIINTSATLPAALDAVSEDGQRVALHLSAEISEQLWVVEPRMLAAGSTERWVGPPPPARLALDEGAAVELVGRHRGSERLWLGRFDLPMPVRSWLASHGRPIRYGYVDTPWPISTYQSVFATEPGSAEMPSAGRPFTPELITRLVAMGVGVSPITLHTGVASLEADELPYPERFRVPAATAERVNAARRSGGRVVAVGTTVVRALESAVDDEGVAQPAEGWTEHVVSPDRGVRVVDGLLTGWHEPEASHLLMLEAIAGRRLLELSYQAALSGDYLWHEFGDVHLILP